MDKTIENVVVSVVCVIILLMLLVPAALDYIEKGKQEESAITANASTSWSCEAWILLGGEWTHIDVKDYSLVNNYLITIYSDDGVKYRTSYENVVIVENGG